MDPRVPPIRASLARAGAGPDSDRAPESGHNQDMRRAPALVLVAAIAVAGVAGCKEQNSATSTLPRPSAAFCKAAGRYDKQVTTGKLALSKQIEMVSAIAANAPKDIEHEANTFLDALKKRKDGDMSVVDNPKVEKAADRVNRRAGQDCGWYQRQGM